MDEAEVKAKQEAGLKTCDARAAAERYANEDVSKWTGTKLFMVRLEREGRKQEWYKRYREKAAENPDVTSTTIRCQVRKDMGFIGKKDELEHYAAFHESLGLTYKGKKNREKQKRHRAKKKEDLKKEVIKNFESAVESLPNEASADDILKWISNHPAMSRWNRTQDKMTVLKLSREDVLEPPHGAAPCKSAVSELQHWMYTPAKFFEKLLDKRVKQAAADVNVKEEEEKTERVVDDVSEIETMLKSVSKKDTPKK